MNRLQVVSCVLVTACAAWAAPEVRQVVFLPSADGSEGRAVPLVTGGPEFVYWPLVGSSRRAWTDDSAWASVNTRLSALGQTASGEGLAGLVADFKDRGNVGQFRLAAGDPDFDATRDLVQRRAREAFRSYFAAHPAGTLVALQLFAADGAAARRYDSRARAIEERDLFPAFANGIVEALPEGARLVDGGMPDSLSFTAANRDFYRSVRDRAIGVLMRVDPELRATYRAAVSTSFVLGQNGFSTDAYVYETDLRQARECAEKFLFLSGGKPGNVDTSDYGLVLRGVADPWTTVRTVRSQRKAAGTYKTISISPGTDTATGTVSVFQGGMVEGAWYGLVVRGRGEGIRGYVYFQSPGGSWRWDLGNFRVWFGEPDADGWRDGTALIRVPREAGRIYLTLGRENYATQPVAYKEIELFRIR